MGPYPKADLSTILYMYLCFILFKNYSTNLNDAAGCYLKQNTKKPRLSYSEKLNGTMYNIN